MKINNRQQFLWVLVFAAAGLWVAVNLVFTPLAGWWTARSAQIKDLRGKVHDGRLLLNRETFIRSHWQDMQAAALPADNSLAEQRLLKAFDTWRSDTGVELASITPQWKTDSTNYMTLSCRLELGGSLGTLSRYLYEMEKGPIALRIDTVELNAKDNTGQQLTLGLEVNAASSRSPNRQKNENIPPPDHFCSPPWRWRPAFPPVRSRMVFPGTRITPGSASSSRTGTSLTRPVIRAPAATPDARPTGRARTRTPARPISRSSAR